jgi:hypothetical protein
MSESQVFLPDNQPSLLAWNHALLSSIALGMEKRGWQVSHIIDS